MGIVTTSQKKRMPKRFIIICVLVWLVGFTYNTGFGISYGIFGAAKVVTILAFLCCMFFRGRRYQFNPGSVFLIVLVIYIEIFNDVRNGNSIQDYLWVWTIIPIMKLFTIEEHHHKWFGFIYGVASIGVLIIGNTTDVFKGWDGNSVSMVQFFSYTVFISIFSEVKAFKNIRNLLIFSAVYFYYLNVFDSRSAILFSIVMLLCMLSVIPARKFLNKITVFIILVFPLLIAIVVMAINETNLAENLNSWSLEAFNKPIFNGRDRLWEKGIKAWIEAPFIGNGDFAYSNYHNSAITALVAVGMIGYALIIGALYKILAKGLKWLDDSVVYGLTMSFLVIWMQQSVELGIIAAKPNIIPYFILGVLYARISTLEGGKNGTAISNNTNLQYR